METTNLYLFKALDAYPYNLEEAVEALNYSLSYDPNNVMALCLMARVQSEQLGDYHAAIEYFEKALACDMENPKTYASYIHVLMQNDDYVEAQKLIEYAMTVKGIDKGGIALLQGQLYEALFEFEMAESALKEALLLGLNSGFISFVEDELSRVSKKRERHNRNKAKSKEVQEPQESSQANWISRLNNLL